MNDAVPAPRLSVVVPAFNEQNRLGATLAEMSRYLRERGDSYETLVVDDASTDRTAEVAGGFSDSGVRVIRFPRNRGKGAAVRAGVLASAGEWILISDADLSAPIQELERLEARAADAHLVLGSRATGESRIGQRQSWARESMGRTFNLIIRSLGMTKIKDTQCGFKLLEGSAGRQLFEHMRVERFAFDVELVWLAQAFGHTVLEVGVAWNNSPRSTVDPLRDSARMFWDVLKLRFRRLPRRP